MFAVLRASLALCSSKIVRTPSNTTLVSVYVCSVLQVWREEREVSLLKLGLRY